jgi:predicted PurR-regulated permease PerM
VLSSFLRGRLVVSLLKGAFIALGLWMIGVPYALLLGCLAAFLSLIPFVGPMIAFLLGFLLAMLHRELFDALWRVGLIYVLAEFVEGYVLMPKVLGESLGLHPMVVLASLMIGGAALGMFGLLLALPIAATVIILTREIVLPALAKTSAERRG